MVQYTGVCVGFNMNKRKILHCFTPFLHSFSSLGSGELAASAAGTAEVLL